LSDSLLGNLKKKISGQRESMQPLLTCFEGILELAGAVAPWDDPRKKKGWLTKGECGEADFCNVGEFCPIIELLMKKYRYNLIYAASAADYDPFDPDKARRFNDMIRRVR
jgi:hypothetical protein